MVNAGFNLRFLWCFGLFLSALIPSSRASSPGDEVIVVYNSNLPESIGVARHYAERRQVPQDRLFGLDLPVGETMTRGEVTRASGPAASKAPTGGQSAGIQQLLQAPHG